jgi:hypothetical protein
MTNGTFFGLDHLLAPVSASEFTNTYWESRMLHLERGEPGYYRDLLGLADVDRVLATGKDHPEFTVSLIQDGVIVHQDGDHVRRFGHGDALQLERLDTQSLYAHHAAGATIRIYRLERHLTPVWNLAADLERQLSAEVSVNLYLTPPGSQGFRVHQDLHDVLVLQIEGEKRWQIYEPQQELPVERPVRVNRKLYENRYPLEWEATTAPLDSGPMREVTLRAGDVLYLPRGYPHAATTGTEGSLHLTVGLNSLTFHELLIHAVTRRLGEERMLRCGLTPGFVTDPRIAQSVADRGPELAEVAATALTPEWLRETVEDLANRYLYHRRPVTAGQMDDVRRLPELTLASRVQVRPGVAARLEARAETVFLFFSGRVLNFPVRAMDLLESILRARRFAVGEIVTQLGDQSRLMMARQLMKEGFLSFDGVAA